jgi:putative ABC transport system permease protein
MFFSDLYNETISAVLVNKARSGLTVLGVIIGIASVIAMISVGQGAQKSVEESIQSMGANLLEISPGVLNNKSGGVSQGRGSAQTLTYQDALDISENVSSIKAVAPKLTSRYQISAKGNNTNAQVVGTVPDYIIINDSDLESGIFINDQDVNNRNRVAIIGSNIRDDLFGENSNPVGQKIKINATTEFKIIGILAETESGGVFGSQDNMIIVPITTAQTYLSNVTYVSSINVQAENQEVLSIVEEEITELLLVNHNILDVEDADFEITNQADLIEAASSTSETFTILLAAIAGISLLVGGIGIMNMMLTAVTERTREIGLRKAIGAKRKEINNQFLAESITLTLVGGVLGIILGWLISFIISKFAGITTDISFYSILLAFGVSAIIGILFGYYPAQRASKLNPIDALKYE